MPARFHIQMKNTNRKKRKINIILQNTQEYLTASREDRKIFTQEERRLLYMHTCMPSNVAEMPIETQKDLTSTFTHLNI